VRMGMRAARKVRRIHGLRGVGRRTDYRSANPVSSGIHGKSRMRTYGSVRGAISDGHPYRDS
jgi:hypothetical protein